MKLQVALVVFVGAFLAGCGRHDKTTDSLSSDFATLDERKSFLENYVTFRRSYDDLQFSLSFLDGGGGAIPSPSEWDIRIFAIVPAEELGGWSKGLKATETPDLGWVKEIPGAPTAPGGFSWFADGAKVAVGIDAELRAVLYRNLAL